MTIHPEVLPDVFAVFKYLQEQGWTGIPYHTPPQFVKEWHSLIKENIAFFMCLSEKEQGDGFSDLLCCKPYVRGQVPDTGGRYMPPEADYLLCSLDDSSVYAC